jgi:hypothetical protein
MRRVFLLAWRLHRAELAAVTVASLTVTLAFLGAAMDLAETHQQCLAIGTRVAPCGGPAEAGQYYTDASQDIQMVFPFAGALPFVAGLVLGVPLASRELEHRTAHLAWPMSRSRPRWLALRLLPLALLGLLALVPAGLAGEVLTRHYYPLTDPGANFEQYGIRGPILVARFVPALLLGAIAGLLVGRQLPALLVAGALAAGMGAGLSALRPFGAAPVERPSRFLEDPVQVGNLYQDIVYRDAQGNLMPEERAWELLGIPEDEVEPDLLPRETFLVIPGTRYPEVLARETGVIAAGSIVLAVGLVAAVRRGRPR